MSGTNRTIDAIGTKTTMLVAGAIGIRGTAGTTGIIDNGTIGNSTFDTGTTDTGVRA